jgi:hypothetical protein
MEVDMAGSRVANKLAANFGSYLLGSVTGLNLNAANGTDVFVPFPDTPTKFRVRAVAMTNGSINPTTARFTINTAAAAGGTAIVSSVTPSLASASVVQDLTIASTATVTGIGGLFINLGTQQGAAATVDIYIYGDIYTA